MLIGFCTNSDFVLKKRAQETIVRNPILLLSGYITARHQTAQSFKKAAKKPL